MLLGRVDGAELPPWEPGAHIDLVLPTGTVRQYSLCGDPADRRTYRIGVLRKPAGHGASAYVHTSLRPGQPVTIRGPRNNFRLVDSERYLFLAGGIGVTPLLPMVKRLAEADADWNLAYAGRTRTSMAFTDELVAHGPRVRVSPTDRNGRLPIKEMLAEPQPGTAIYACGPAALLDEISAQCAHWAEGTLHIERFESSAGVARDGTAKPSTGQDAPIEVTCRRSGRTITVPADRSILAALGDAGIVVDSSCREGLCGTCETRVLDGVPDHRDEVLDDEERRRGDVMYLCVSRAITPHLVLDV